MSRGVARVACSCTLRVEVYDRLDGAESRLAAEQDKRLAKATKNAAALDKGESLVPLDDQGRKLGQEQPSRARPSLVLLDLAPMRWTLVRNSFRKADTFKARFPLAVLPVHPSAIRAVTCVVRLRAMTAAEWSDGIQLGRLGPSGAPRSRPSVGAGDEGADFVGIAKTIDDEVSGDKIPSFELDFVDYVGLLGSKKVRPGLEFDESIPISESITKFLLGSPAEGIRVVWVDQAPEPDFGRYRPRMTKRKAGASKSARPATPKENYLDAISHACGMLGVVPRIVGPRLVLAFGGTMYEGRASDVPRDTLLATNLVESLKAKHDLLGAKTRPIQVVSYDVDTQQNHTARWPPASGKNQALSSGADGKLPLVPTVAGNVGIPGFTQLDESIEMVPVAPVSDPSILPRVAESLFLEKQRQRVHYTLTTHSPWADPGAPDAEGGRLLHLQAGDAMTFGVGAITAGAGGRSLAGLRAVAGELDEAGVLAELKASGVPADVAEKVAAAIASTPKTDRFRVDTLEVTGAEGGDVELQIGLVTYTAIVSDLQGLAYGQASGGDAADALKSAAADKSIPKADVRATAVEARKRVRALGLPPGDEAAHLGGIDGLERAALKGK